MKKTEFLKVWAAHFAQVRAKQYAGDPHGPACRAMCVLDDAKAGEKHWRNYRAYYAHNMTAEQLAAKLAADRQEKEAR